MFKFLIRVGYTNMQPIVYELPHAGADGATPPSKERTDMR